MTSPDLPTLIALRVQGVASDERLASALCVPCDQARARASALVGEGLASERTGRLSGFSLTPDGLGSLQKCLEDEGLKGDAGLRDLYERFCVLNTTLLKVATDWQVRRHGPIEAANDHKDADYDQSVIDRLRELHDRVGSLLGRIEACAPRFAAYRSRLEECVRRVEGGDTKAFTAVMAESYHTVWFEMHEDLLVTLGVSREEEG